MLNERAILNILKRQLKTALFDFHQRADQKPVGFLWTINRRFHKNNILSVTVQEVYFFILT